MHVRSEHLTLVGTEPPTRLWIVTDPCVTGRVDGHRNQVDDRELVDLDDLDDLGDDLDDLDDLDDDDDDDDDWFDDAGQATAEYALVLLGAALVAVGVIAWATAGGGAGKIGGLLDAVLDAVRGRIA